MCNDIKKSNLHYTGDITPKRATSAGARLCGFSWYHNSEETLQWWRAVDDTVPDFTDPGIETQTSRTDCDVFENYSNRSYSSLYNKLTNNIFSTVQQFIAQIVASTDFP